MVTVIFFFSRYNFSEVMLVKGDYWLWYWYGKTHKLLWKRPKLCEFVFPVGVDGFRDEWRVCHSAHRSTSCLMEHVQVKKYTFRISLPVYVICQNLVKEN